MSDFPDNDEIAPLSQGFLDEMYRRLMSEPDQTVMVNGVPRFSIEVHPSIPPHQVALTQYLIDHWDVLHPDDDFIEYDD